MSRYWNDQGRFQEEFTRLTNELMPGVGAADTLGGECIRAANRLYYDAFNNGFCNNTSGALNFLKARLLPYFGDESDRALHDAVRFIEPKTNTGGYSKVCEETGAALDLIVDSVAEFVLNHPDARRANSEDMLDYTDPDETVAWDYDEDEY